MPYDLYEFHQFNGDSVKCLVDKIDMPNEKSRLEFKLVFP